MKSSVKLIGQSVFMRLVISGAILLSISLAAQAQKETEVFIPVRKSPGISGKFSLIGNVQTVNAKDSVITIKTESSDEIKNIKVMAATLIYLDKSSLKQTNQKGMLSDIKQGLMVEIKFKDNKATGSCEWIKVQLK